MQLEILHTTRFSYEVPPSFGLLQLRVRPRSNVLQSVDAWNVHLEGLTEHAAFQDQHGNEVDLVEIASGSAEIEISVSGKVTTHDRGGMLGAHDNFSPLWYYRRQSELTEPTKSIQEFCEPFTKRDLSDVSTLHGLSAAILEAVSYLPGTTNVTTTASEALTAKNGVCQDHTHIMLSAARWIGYPARYVSGYLRMEDRDVQDASHAWAEIFVQDLGWVGFDVSNGISPDERYVRLSLGLDYRDAAPTHGIMLGADNEKLDVSLNVQQ